MNSILITGCNRGIGLGLVKALVKSSNPPQYIFATCRNLQKATELMDLASGNPSIHVMEIDLNNFDSYTNLIRSISDIVKEKGLNVLFNNAGFAPKSTRITTIKLEDLMLSLQTNTVAPIMLTKACLPLLKQASAANEKEEMSVRRAAIINMSSILGSIEANTDGAMYAYRTSKSALNAATKSMSIDLLHNKILCLSLHPGWVRTDMGGSNAPLDVNTSSTKIIETLLKFNETNNGGFYQYDGKRLPW
ncbi:C-factor [Anastrepha obliqua]|uniref:C-factor n=1 Tax=Anastrepha ludens TaxID=28586 RepID=UPI0023B1BBE1|nr:C-factor [Anastrepha ludens]XP_054727822.1 C-factor [Anastrepha obliqua]